MTGTVARRRRGAELEDAICRAAFEELTGVGYAAFTIESVAARAGTGKASIYRRWPTKDHLLLDAFCRGIPSPVDYLQASDVADELSTRDVLVKAATMMVTVTELKSEAIHAVASEAVRDPEMGRALDRETLAPRREALADLLRRGIERGEVRADAPIDWVSELIPSVMIMRKLFRRDDGALDAVIDLIDRVVMPLLVPAPTTERR